MKRGLLILFIFGLITSVSAQTETEYGSMEQWKLHPAYSNVEVITTSATDVYALSEGALFSVNKEDESISYYSKLDGLSSADIQYIAFNRTVNKLVIIYRNGMIDVVANGKITALSDLYIKRETTEMSINNITLYGQYAYLSTSFGIIVVDVKKNEIKDTYYIGPEASDIFIKDIAICSDSLYAVTDSVLYKGALKDNLIDYHLWKNCKLPKKENLQALVALDQLYALQDSTLYVYSKGSWVPLNTGKYRWVRENSNQLLGGTYANQLVSIQPNGKETFLTDEYEVKDAVYEDGEYWLSAGWNGVVRYSDGSFQNFSPNGPFTNLPYRIQYAGGRIMMTQGGRWSTQFLRPGHVMWYYEPSSEWRVISNNNTAQHINTFIYDIMNYAVDPNDDTHFFATTYGNGVVEFKDWEAVRLYNENNSTLRSAVNDDTKQKYVRTDGALYDAHGNLWVLNTGDRGTPINILSPDGVWHQLPLRVNGQSVTLTTPGPLVADTKYPNSKWFMDCRSNPAVYVIDDNGTPFNSSDDHVMKRTTFVDQNGTAFTPVNFYTMAQDQDGLLWVGTNAGLFMIESVEKFLESNACQRVIISREDGTGLADYLLADEQINCIAVDGGNRKWIGTATSGLYLMSADGLETIYHFTTDNSPIPSNQVISLAIHSITGDVYIGTANGLASFRSDASEPDETYDYVYAYPNPVRPNYEGVITIARLMDHSYVNIIDAGGNLVCKTRSNGGIAVWDGKDLHGNRVASGIYTVLCNSVEGGEHKVTKILILH